MQPETHYPTTQQGVVFVSLNTVRCMQKSIRPLRDNEILVQIELAGICGAESRAIKGGKKGVNATSVKSGIILGHEGVGIIHAIGSAVSHYAIGDRVAILSHVPCGNCTSCTQGHTNRCLKLEHIGFTRDGSAAEYIILPAQHPTIMKIPHDIPAKIGTLIEPLSCVLHGLRRLHPDYFYALHQKQVLILGAGPIGMIWALFGLSNGATSITIVDPQKNIDLIYKAIPHIYKNRVHVLSSIEHVPKNSVDTAIIANSDPQSASLLPPYLTQESEIVSFAGLNGYSPKLQSDGTYGFDLDTDTWQSLNPILLSEVHYKEIRHAIFLDNTKIIYLVGSSGYTIDDAEMVLKLFIKKPNLYELFTPIITHELNLREAAEVYSHFGDHAQLSQGTYNADQAIQMIIRP
ncbi:MAG: alcohol dehydrogenase catalytic domain-containing protein [Candidatus Kerfeldbacteria bacterium]|nr:alcohol dehydrogenase catalytic domain-containing protein [Candidatus Kerfeldbacteria bacterium]